MDVGIDAELLARREIGHLQIDVVVNGTRLIGSLISDPDLPIGDFQFVQRDRTI